MLTTNTDHCGTDEFGRRHLRLVVADVAFLVVLLKPNVHAAGEKQVDESAQRF